MRSFPATTRPKAYLIKEAAEMAERSDTWVRQQRRFGALIPAEIDGLQAVTADSLAALLARSEPAANRIRLIVDNTK